MQTQQFSTLTLRGMDQSPSPSLDLALDSAANEKPDHIPFADVVQSLSSTSISLSKSTSDSETKTPQTVEVISDDPNIAVEVFEDNEESARITPNGEATSKLDSHNDDEGMQILPSNSVKFRSKNSKALLGDQTENTASPTRAASDVSAPLTSVADSSQELEAKFPSQSHRSEPEYQNAKAKDAISLRTPSELAFFSHQQQTVSSAIVHPLSSPNRINSPDLTSITTLEHKPAEMGKQTLRLQPVSKATSQFATETISIPLGAIDEQHRLTPTKMPIKRLDIEPKNQTISALQAMISAPIAHNSIETKPIIETANGFSEVRFDSTLDTKQTTLTSLSTTVARPDPTSRVPRQIADAIHARVTSERVIEISLNPAELGRLKLSITPAENGIVINIIAERSEITDLIRRNLNDLEQAFSEMGHENITFSFEQDDGADDQKHPEHQETLIEDLDWSTKTIETTTNKSRQEDGDAITSGIDIRI